MEARHRVRRPCATGCTSVDISRNTLAIRAEGSSLLLTRAFRSSRGEIERWGRATETSNGDAGDEHSPRDRADVR